MTVTSYTLTGFSIAQLSLVSSGWNDLNPHFRPFTQPLAVK